MTKHGRRPGFLSGRFFVLVLTVPAAVASVVLAAGVFEPARAADSECETAATRGDPDNPLGYRRRGDRCEGEYVRDVSASGSLLIASLTENFEEFDTSLKDPLRVSWTAPEGATVTIQGYSLRFRLHYRMRTLRPSKDSAYVWTTSLLRQLGVKRADLGVVGVARVPLGGTAREVLVPLRIAQKVVSPPLPSLRVTLYPSVELEEVFVTVAPVDAAGKTGAPVKDAVPQQLGYYPAERGVTIPLPVIPGRGVFLLELSAKLAAGGSSVARTFFYNHGAGGG
jgi:hypothetical protein